MAEESCNYPRSVLSSWRRLGVSYNQNMGYKETLITYPFLVPCPSQEAQAGVDSEEGGHPYGLTMTLWECPGSLSHLQGEWDGSGATVQHFLLHSASTVYLGSEPRQWGHDEGLRDSSLGP